MFPTVLSVRLKKDGESRMLSCGLPGWRVLASPQLSGTAWVPLVPPICSAMTEGTERKRKSARERKTRGEVQQVKFALVIISASRISGSALWSPDAA